MPIPETSKIHPSSESDPPKLFLLPAVAADVAGAPTPTQRALLVFHGGPEAAESAALLAVAPELRRRGWTLDGVFTSGGTPIADRHGLASVERLERPPAVSLASWRRPSNALASLRRVPVYVLGFVRILRQRNPHVIHCNTTASLPEAMIARVLGFAVVIAVPEASVEMVPDGRRPAPGPHAGTVELAYQVALQRRFAPRFTKSGDPLG